MKKAVYLLLVGFLIACSSDIDLGNENFVREYGTTGSASIKGIFEMENGELLLCGYSTKSRFVTENSVGQVNDQRVIERTNYIAHCDKNGRVIRETTIPVSSLIYDSRIDLGDLNGKSWFVNIFPREGGYLVLGEFRNFPIYVNTVNPQGEPVAFEREAQPGNNIPYLLYLDQNFNVEKIWHPNATPWDYQLHANATLKRQPDGNGFVFMTGINGDGVTGNLMGMQFFDLDATGKIVSAKNHYPQAFLTFARDFTFKADGNILAIGSQSNNYSLFEFDPNSFMLISRRPFARENQFPFNNNPFLIEALDNGEYFGFYTDPTLLSNIIRFDQAFIEGPPIDMEPNLDDIYPIESLVCGNGDVLMYANNLSNSFSEAGILYRIAPDGSLVFRKAFPSSIEDVYETEDGGILVSTEVITRDGITKAYLTKYNSDGSL